MGGFIILLLLGIGLAVLGWWRLMVGMRLGRVCTVQTRGHISSVREDVREPQGKQVRKIREYTPTYTYDVQGHAVTGKGLTYSRSRRRYKEGAIVTVRYNPDNPAEFVVEGDAPSAVMAVVVIIGGFAMMAVACLTAFK